MTVVFGWRRAVPQVTKRPEIADRGLPPEDPFLLANQPPPFCVTDTPHNEQDNKISCFVYDVEVQSSYDRDKEAQFANGF